MKPLTALDPETKSPDIVAENIDHLKTLFPEAFTEGKLDFDVLKQLLGGTIEEREEKYGLNWHGKRRARQLALTPSTGTLRPCPEDSVDWDTTRNLMIEGDNLEVLKLLQKSYAGKVKLIYIDPPYNTGNDFVYPDDFQDNIKNYLELTGQVDSTGKRLFSNTEASGRFHTDWLNMMYPRLKLARNLLTADGVIFITIDDVEVSNLRKLCDEVFGEENFIAQIEWQKRYTRSNNTDGFTSVIDHILMFGKSDEAKPQLMDRDEAADARYENPDNDPRGPWKPIPFSNPLSPEERPNLAYTIVNPITGEQIKPLRKAWRSSEEVFKKHVQENRVWWGKDGSSKVPNIKRFLSEVRQGMTPINLWAHDFAGHTDQANAEIKAIFGDKVFDTPKPTLLIQRMLELSTTPNEAHLVLDFFAGSGSTAHAVFKHNLKDSGNRRFILVQMPEAISPELPASKAGFKNITDITKERVRRAKKQLVEENPMFAGDLGFRVFKLASSNIRAWEPNRDDLPKTLEDSVEHLKMDRNEQDILFELLLKLGLDLTIGIEHKAIAEKTVYSIGLGALLVCLDQHIGVADVEPLAFGIVGWHKELASAIETLVVFRDNAFADDVIKTNLTAILQQYGIGNVRSL
jgi:adenine-specific DNA-methyltransferase